MFLGRFQIRWASSRRTSGTVSGLDRHQLRVGHGPHVIATLRNTAITLLRLTGWTSIAAGLRYHARDASRPVNLLTTT